MADYMRSLEKLLDFKIEVLLPGHGPHMDDPYGKIHEYIEHRRMRERQVLRCLQEGRHTIDAMVEVIYQDLTPVLISVAGRSVEAHLIKLLGEKKIRREGDRYILSQAT